MTRRATAPVALIAPVALFTVVLAVLGLPGTALADPPGPTDYRSEVVELIPPTDTIEVGVVGGDSFVTLAVDPGTEVVVIGYEGEPYLRIDPNGEVFENRRSPATYYNEERFGGSIPPEADAAAEPQWTRVGGGGSWAWHDHRAHRMEEFAPVNVERGDPVLDAVVPMVVDGSPVEVHIVSTWMPAPSRWPGLLGALVGLGVVIGLVLAAGRETGLAVSLVAVSALAFAVGTIQYRSLPAATGPRSLWWLAPLVALVCSLAALLVARRPARWAAPWAARWAARWAGVPVVVGASAIAAVQLLVWGFERRSGLGRAILPTDAPFWLDRFATGAALSAGLVASAVAVWTFVEPAMAGTGRRTGTGVSSSTRPAPARSPR